MPPLPPRTPAPLLPPPTPRQLCTCKHPPSMYCECKLPPPPHLVRCPGEDVMNNDWYNLREHTSTKRAENKSESNTTPMCTCQQTTSNVSEAARVQNRGLALQASLDQPDVCNVSRPHIRVGNPAPVVVPIWQESHGPVHRVEMPTIRIRSEEVCPWLHNGSDRLAQRQEHKHEDDSWATACLMRKREHKHESDIMVTT